LQMVGNVSSHNATGVRVGEIDDAEIVANSLTGNNGAGIFVNGGTTQTVHITDNTIVGNIGAGVYLLGWIADPLIQRNNIYGNAGVSSPDLPALDTRNCGIANVDVQQPLVATNNYWGSASGPGPDPADNAGKGCDFLAGSTIVKPFATTGFGIRP